MEKDCIDLISLQNQLGECVTDAFPSAFWLSAETASVQERRGHCYLDLCQCVDGVVEAEARAIIWASTYRQIAPYFEFETGSKLQAGQQVCLQVTVNYSPLYGLSLIVNDIDPEYTLGDASRRRAETLERLRKEGLMEAQKEHVLADLPYRLAVISSESAAGYRDFLRHLHENEYGFKFSTDLYASAVQGADCAPGVAKAVGEIVKSGVDYDAVLLLRGGGGQLDLACFDEYELCAAIAGCPFPVLTAVGHDQDTHICDMVAYEALKTPTALADYFLDIYAAADARIAQLKSRLANVRNTRIALMLSRLDVLKARLDAADPMRMLEKGFVMVLGPDDHPLRSAAAVKKGDALAILLRDGRVSAVATEIEVIRQTQG